MSVLLYGIFVLHPTATALQRPSVRAIERLTDGDAIRNSSSRGPFDMLTNAFCIFV